MSRYSIKLVNYAFYFIGVSGAFAVLFSAWLNHVGKEMLVHDMQGSVIALSLQFVHTLALLVSVVWLKVENNLLHTNLTIVACKNTSWRIKAISIALWCFMLGILLFSGILYLKAFLPLGFLGKLTPFGGISLTLGWIMLAIAAKE